MDQQYQVVIYGASGYTGKLIAWKLAERGIPFIAAGRDLGRLESEMGAIAELKGHDYRCVAVKNERSALAELFRGRKVVLNVVGPFMQLGEPVVQACLDAGCHYFDTTGEADWMFLLKREYGPRFAAAGLALCPANSYMWTEGLLAAEIALETPGVDSLDIVYLADSAVSVASTKSFLRMCTKPQYYLQNRALAAWPQATSYSVNLPGEHLPFNALPWSGGGEPVWYEGDARVRNCRVLVSFRNQAAFGAVFGMLQRFEQECRDLPPDEQERLTNQWGADLTTAEPSREDPDVNRCVLSCHARGNTQSVSVVLRGNSPYIQTGVLGAEAARRVLRGQLQAVGFVSPTQAFGARNLLGALAEEGYLAWQVSSH
ncbi:MAG TPA: DUF5938 domain-containing protein [Aromatoleum sp.]|uniref:saccharopine dehydrogenase family protein n=1 Tax=Aromatoleum sp. TaxID=2307007 RepID=UPI002B48C3F4|nr:DUF5938 domain-containing protein [Aromatoleum sp.]HJV27701.1 DUF5938 domain-containing protein [Aromatoleum sp.]